MRVFSDVMVGKLELECVALSALSIDSTGQPQGLPHAMRFVFQHEHWA